MAPTPDQSDYILPEPYRTETIYYQLENPKINKFQTTTYKINRHVNYALKWSNNTIQRAN